MKRDFLREARQALLRDLSAEAVDGRMVKVALRAWRWAEDGYPELRKAWEELNEFVGEPLWDDVVKNVGVIACYRVIREREEMENAI